MEVNTRQEMEVNTRQEMEDNTSEKHPETFTEIDQAEMPEQLPPHLSHVVEVESEPPLLPQPAPPPYSSAHATSSGLQNKTAKIILPQKSQLAHEKDFNGDKSNPDQEDRDENVGEEEYKQYCEKQKLSDDDEQQQQQQDEEQDDDETNQFVENALHFYSQRLRRCVQEHSETGASVAAVSNMTKKKLHRGLTSPAAKKKVAELRQKMKRYGVRRSVLEGAVEHRNVSGSDEDINGYEKDVDSYASGESEDSLNDSKMPRRINKETRSPTLDQPALDQPSSRRNPSDRKNAVVAATALQKRVGLSRKNSLSWGLKDPHSNEMATTTF